MIIRRTNSQTSLPVSGAAESFAAMQRHHSVVAGASPPPPPPAGPPNDGDDGGDVVYGARAIAIYLFRDDSDRARRRVFCLWAYYHARKEKAGFFKLKGALCLSKSQWKKFHGMG